jgi:hypothetical protein
MEALLVGHLEPFKHFVVTDTTLSPEIRNDNTLTVYYRGGSLIRVERNAGTGNYRAVFNPKYLHHSYRDAATVTAWHEQIQALIDEPELNTPEDVQAWLKAIPAIKAVMDLWCARRERREDDFLQILVRENKATSTDYFVCDAQHAVGNTRFDFVAVHWPSTARDRRNGERRGLVIGEMKYDDGALAGRQGLVGHLQRLQKFLGIEHNLPALKAGMIDVFNQKKELGIIRNQRKLVSFEAGPPTWLLVLANHDPEKTALARELRTIVTIQENLPVIIKVAVASHMGYGLFDQRIYGLKEFLKAYYPTK